MNKKMIFLTLGVGIVGFAGMFAFAWFTSPAPMSTDQDQQIADSAKVNTAGEEKQPSAAIDQIAMMAMPTKRTVTDQQIQALIFEIREKIKEYDLKLRDLGIREERLLAAQDNLKKDIEDMASLRVELASSVASLKDEQQKLLQSKLEIEKAEQENLISLAATYDKMDAEIAGKIFINMIKNANTSNGPDDAVKILYYMTERTKAKALASIAEAEPAASVFICQRLKRLITKE